MKPRALGYMTSRRRSNAGRKPIGRDVALRYPENTTATPAYAIGRAISDALDPMQAPGKVRMMADMSPEELAKLQPPRKKP